MAIKLGRLLKCVTAISTASVLLGTIVSTMPKPPVSAASEVVVNLSEEKQVIRGFGGINHPEWIGDMTESQRQTAFGNGDNELGFSVLRVYVNDDPNQWYRAVPTAKAAIARGAIVFASPWNPPASMTENFTRNGQSAKRLRYDKYAVYAQHLNDFVTYMKDNGVDLYAISVQNEPDYAHDWTWWTPEEMLNFMENYADAINCRVIAPESFSYLKNISDPILNSEKALANMEILGAHLYGTQYKDFSYPLFEQKGKGKELWMTEVYYPNSEADSNDRWDEALDLSHHISNSLTDANMQAYVWWYIRRNYGPMKEDGTISKRGYVMAQFSKYIRPDYVRVGATKNPSDNVYVSAYKGDDDGKVVIVAVNKGTEGYSQRFSISGEGIAGVDRYRTSASENLAASINIEASDSGFWAQLPAESISTFVVTLSNEPDANGYYFHDEFEDTNYDWTERGGTTLELSGRTPYMGINALLVSSRTASWNGAQKALSTSVFKPNIGYSFSACLKYLDGGNTETFHLTLQYTDANGETRYQKIDTKTAVKGEYVQLFNQNYIIPDGASNLYFYVETEGSTMNFYIDEAIGAIAGTVIKGPAEINFRLGDLNSDGVINAADVSMGKCYLLGADIGTIAELAADVDQSGTVDETDVQLLKEFVVGKTSEFPVASSKIISSTEYMTAARMMIVESEPAAAVQENSNISYGSFQKVTYYSKTCKRDRKANVLLPANYSTNKSYPVLYILHGYWGNEDSLLDAGDASLKLRQIIGNAIAQEEAKEMIVVFPYIYASETRETLSGMNDESNAAYDNFINDLINDLMPYMAENFSTAQGRENTAITGFSMGGRESLYIGFSRPDLFAYVGAMCPAPGVSPGLIAQDNFKFKDEKTNPYLLMISAGSNDGVVGQVPSGYHSILDANKVDHIWHYVNSGDHGGYTIRPHIYNFVRTIFKV